jgi:thymidylate kinase
VNNEKPAILVIEGVDCVGKTTLAQAIATRHDFHYLYTPQSPLAEIRKEVESLDDPNTRFFYYLTSVVAVQKTMQSILSQGKSLVIDRYIYSTVVMHHMLGVDTGCINACRLPILWPTVSVLLVANSETRTLRRNGRDGIREYDQRIEQSTALLDKAQEAYRVACEWSLILETDNLLSIQVEERVVNLLQEKTNHV